MPIWPDKMTGAERAAARTARNIERGIPQREAAAEALRSFKKASAERKRTKIWAYPKRGRRVDVTEHVVSLLDMITQSMDWGSDFWTDTDLPSFIELCKLLDFDELPGESGNLPLCRRGVIIRPLAGAGRRGTGRGGGGVLTGAGTGGGAGWPRCSGATGDDDGARSEVV